jgi:DNA-binding HxlR family transcriptional regulator
LRNASNPRYGVPVPYRSFEGQNCSIARALEVLGERWTLLILREVLLGRRRFEELRRNTGVATNILTDRLATLVDHEILERRAEEYVPTRKAIDAGPVLVALMQWGDEHAAPDGPPRVLVHARCEHDAQPALRCGHCAQEIRPGELRVRPGPGASERQRGEPLLPVRG